MNKSPEAGAVLGIPAKRIIGMKSRKISLIFNKCPPCAWLLWHWSNGLVGTKSNWQREISVKKPFKMGFRFSSTLKMQIQPLNPLKTVSKACDLSSTIAMTTHCFGALSQVGTFGHCVIGQGHDFLWPDWLNWWVWPWVPAFETQIVLTP